MSNTWFRFRQFLIRQEKAAMKVGTDGVLLGAWSNIPDKSEYVLDIGTGTGLLALMIAQRHPKVYIDAIEIDIQATEQARENIVKSPWSDRIKVYHNAFQTFKPGEARRYHLIITNPPFFSGDVLSSPQQRDLARSELHLKLEDIFHYSSQRIHSEGLLSMIIPADREDDARSIAAENNFFCRKLTKVKPTPQKKTRRLLMEFSPVEGIILEDELVIEESGRHAYSKEYRELTKDFYL